VLNVHRKTSSAAKEIQPGESTKKSAISPDTVRREYAGKYVAWAPDGITIVAVATSFGAAERKAAKAGFPAVAVARMPRGRTIS
jgi:hypothetical protein